MPVAQKLDEIQYTPDEDVENVLKHLPPTRLRLSSPDDYFIKTIWTSSVGNASTSGKSLKTTLLTHFTYRT